ncbi:MAG: PAS domain S-box protein, partial [Verrucomicrobia bacterium]|nr:PAS domain S-box protein [Verrucomicrobiota bacterium]
TTQHANSLRVSPQLVARLAALLAICVGGSVLIGWLFDVGSLKSLHPTWVSMKANAAVCFLLSGLALWLMQRLPSPAQTAISRACAGLVVLIGALTLAEYLFGWDLGLDQLLFHEASGAVGTIYPGRMPLNAALNFLLVGATLLRFGTRRGQVWFHFAAATVTLFALLALMGFLIQGTSMFAFATKTEMAVHGATVFFFLGVGLWFAHFGAEHPGAASFEQELAMGFGTVLALFVVFASVVYQNTRQVQDAGEWHSHTHEMQANIESIRATVADAETGMCGFVLTSQEGFLEPYQAARARIQDQLRSVRELTADAPSQQQRLAELEGLIRTNLQYHARVIQLAKTQGSEAARQAVLTGEGKRGMNAIRRVINDLHAEEDRSLTLRQTAWKTSNFVSHTTLVLLTGAILTLLLATYYPLKSIVVARHRATEKLRDSEERYRTVAEFTYDMEYWRLPDGSVSYMSPSCERITGYPPQQFQQDRGLLLNIVHPDDRQRLESHFQSADEATADQGLCEMEFRILTRDSQERWISHVCQRIFDRDGKSLGRRASNRDVTERKQAEESLARLAAIVQSSDDCIIGKDLNGIITSWNEGAERMFGYAPSEVVGTSIMRLIPADRRAEENHILEQIKRGTSVDHFETLRETKAGRLIDVSVTASPIKDAAGNIVGVSQMARDITERKRAEEKIAHTLAELERSNKELELFAYVASHDLQEPLRMVSSYTQLLARRYEGQLDDKARKYIHYAVDGAARMQTLIDDLLAYSRVGARSKPLETIASSSPLDKARRNLAARIKETAAVITNDELPTVRADPAQLLLVFQNLLSNALKFHRADSPSVHVAAQDRGSEWMFSVKDNGIGIEPQHAERIFVIFQRLHTREEYPGTGIGLAICKRIVERHGGKIWLESEPGKGATFFFTIPK